MAIESQGTKLEIGKTGSGVKTVTDIFVGYPTILSTAAVAHNLAAGDRVLMELFAGADAGLINSKIFVVKYVTAQTFAIDLDTTGKTITDNANTAKATVRDWTEVGEIVDINRDDPGASEIDVTHLTSTSKEFLMGLQDFGTYSLTVNFLFDDAGQEALRAALASRAVQSFRVTYSDGSTMSFDGFVTGFSGPAASVDDKLTGSVTIKVSGDITYG